MASACSASTNQSSTSASASSHEVRTDRLFREGWRSFYETLADHREGLGVPAPSLEVS